MTDDSGSGLSRRCAIGALASLGALWAPERGLAEQLASWAPNTAGKRPEKGFSASSRRVGGAPWLTLPTTPELPKPPHEGHLAINAASIYFAQFGEGPPLLLLHGGLANSNYWGHQVEQLAGNFTVTVMDTRGHGKSPVSSQKYGYALFAEDVVGLLNELKIPSTSIVGWSDGGIIGLQLAMTRPERVNKLFAFGANGSSEGLKSRGARSPVFRSFAERCKHEYQALSPHPERWAQLLEGLRAMWRSQPNFNSRQLSLVKAPTAISDGQYDEIIKLEHTIRLSREIAGARLIIQPNVSHFAMLQNPEQFNRAVVEFLGPG